MHEVPFYKVSLKISARAIGCVWILNPTYFLVGSSCSYVTSGSRAKI